MGANNFVSFPAVAEGASGPQATIDLFSAVPTSGLDSSLTFICTGKFSDLISIQGSTDGTDWSTLCQFDGGDVGDHGGLQSPVTITGSVVRYLRVFVGGVVMSTVHISVSGEQNCPGAGGFQVSIDRFGVTSITNTDGFALQLDDQKYVDFDKFGPAISVYLSILGTIAAAPLPGGVSVWASPTQGDVTGSGTLLALVELPTAGTAAALLGFDQSHVVANPGGKKYVAVTSFAGATGAEFPASSVTLTYKGFLLVLKG